MQNQPSTNPTPQSVLPRGVATSEFWVSIISAALTAALPYLADMPNTYKVVSAFISVLPIMAYAFQRGQVKQAALNNPTTQTYNVVRQSTTPTTPTTPATPSATPSQS